MGEKFLNDAIAAAVQRAFKALHLPVEMIFFGGEADADTRRLLEEVAGLSDLIGLSVFDFEQSSDQAARYHVQRAPCLVVAAKDGELLTDYGIRFSGTPSGHEFTTLINDLVMVSNRHSGLSQETCEFLKGLEKPVLLQVFLTPTCPACPRAVVLAHQFALESPLVQAEAVEVLEFPELAKQHKVMGVPHTAINGGVGLPIIGAVPEGHLVNEIRKVLEGQA